MTKKLYFGLGRCQPFHDGHEQYIKNTIDKAEAEDADVLFFLGSPFESRTPKNPWTYAERVGMIHDKFPGLNIMPLLDYRYDNQKWYNNLINCVFDYCKRNKIEKVVLSYVGKDEATLRYQYEIVDHLQCEMYEAVPKVFADTPDFDEDIHATDIRAEYFAGTAIDSDYFPVSDYVKTFLADFRFKGDYKKLVDEIKATHDYKKSWSYSPFPPTFQAVDVVPVVHDRWGKPHVALITRKSEFGNGKHAICGGFLHIEKTILESALTEVEEEMGGNIEQLLRNEKGFKLKQIKVFDEVGRSSRGRMITTVHHFEAGAGTFVNLPKLVAGDDAATADWYGIDWIANNRHRFFADHYHILDKLLNVSQYENIENYL